VAPAADDPTEPSRGPGTELTRLPRGERYVLLEELGAGAMGVVYAAYDTALDRRVAIKLLHADLLGGEHQAWLVAEARALARLTHPNVVPVFDVGQLDGRVYFTMELVRGQTLDAWLAEPRSVEAIAQAFREAARGLAAAHRAGLVHRDVKPSNLLRGDDGRTRVADFGIAQAPRSDEAGAGRDGMVTGFAGSLAYMAPEQLRDARADARSDQFSLCVALYQAIHGTRPFAGDTVDELLASMANGPSPGPRPQPPWLTDAVARGLAIDPSARFAHLDALADALVPPRPTTRRRLLVAGVVALGIGASVVAVTRRGDAPATPTCAEIAAGIDLSWTPARQSTVRGGGEVGATIAAQLDRYVDGWRHARRAACHSATIAHTWTADLDVRAGQCLEERRRAFDQTLTALGVDEGRLDVATAGSAIGALRPVTPCGDPDYLRSTTPTPGSPETLAARLELARRIDDLATAAGLGRAELAAVPGLRAEAAALDDGHARARLALLEGDHARDRGDVAAAIRHHAEAYELARGARSPVTAALSAVALIWDHGLVGEDVDRAGDWALVAAAEAATLGDQDVGVAVHYALGVLAERRGDLAAAIPEVERAVALSERETGPDGYRTAQLRAALASMLADAGRFDEALPPHRAAIAVIERWVGVDSLTLVRPLNNLALTESSAGHHAEAEAGCRRALAIAERHGSPELRGTTARNLGVVLVNGGRRAEAIEFYDRAEQLLREGGRPAAAAAAVVQRGIARTSDALATGGPAQLAAARADLERGRAEVIEILGADSPDAADAAAALADLRAGMGACGDAVRLAREAIAIYDRGELPPAQRKVAVDVLTRCR
jgi:tetratricopeptide (TPR) repeat protein